MSPTKTTETQGGDSEGKGKSNINKERKFGDLSQPLKLTNVI